MIRSSTQQSFIQIKLFGEVKPNEAERQKGGRERGRENDEQKIIMAIYFNHLPDAFTSTPSSSLCLLQLMRKWPLTDASDMLFYFEEELRVYDDTLIVIVRNGAYFPLLEHSGHFCTDRLTGVSIL